MKKFELHMGIALIIITTILDVMFPFAIPFSKSNLALICLLSAMGYVSAYLYIDSYLGRHEMYYYSKGYEDCYKESEPLREKLSK
jgi:hypothetical protein